MNTQDALNIFNFNDFIFTEYFMEESNKVEIISIDLNIYDNNEYINFCLLLALIAYEKNKGIEYINNPSLDDFIDFIERHEKNKRTDKNLFIRDNEQTDYLTIIDLLVFMKDENKEDIERLEELANKYIFFESNNLDVYNKEHHKIYCMNKMV